MKINNIIILGGKYMKKMKRLILAVCAALAACCIFHFTGCAGGENGSEEETPMPSATAAVTATPASEPKSPEPTATPEAGPENLLEYAIEDDSLLLGGYSWVAIEESWAGPLQEKRDGCESPAMQEFTETTCSDGEEGICYHFYSEATTGYHLLTNTYGISDLVEANKTYKLTVSLKFTVPKPGEGRDKIAVGCNLSKASKVEVGSSENWQTISTTFTVGDEFETVYIYVGPYTMDHETIVLGDIQAGFDLLIDSISLVEVSA